MNGPLGFDVEHVFRYHAPTPEQIVRYGAIRSVADSLHRRRGDAGSR